MGVSVSRLQSALSSLLSWGKDKEVRILMVGLDSAGKVSWASGAKRATERASGWVGERVGWASGLVGLNRTRWGGGGGSTGEWNRGS